MQGGTADIAPSPSPPTATPTFTPMPPTPTATSVPLRGPGTVSVSVDLCVQDWSTGLTIDGICHFDLEMDVYRCDLNRSLGTDLNEDLVVDANDTCQAELGLDPHPTTPLFDYDAYTITGYQDTKEGWCTFETGQTALTVPFEIIPPTPNAAVGRLRLYRPRTRTPSRGLSNPGVRSLDD